MVRNERGHTLIQVVIATAMLSVLTGAALSGGQAHFASIGRAYHELQVSEAASSRLEAHASGETGLTEGEREFATPRGMTGSEQVKMIRPGLYEVTVRVRAENIPPVTLATLVHRGGAR